MALFSAMRSGPADPSPLKSILLQALDQVQPTGRVHHTRDVTGLERERGVLKLLLHVATAEISQVAPLARAAAVGLGDCEVAERDLPALDALLVRLDDLLCVFLAAGDIRLRAGAKVSALVLFNARLRVTSVLCRPAKAFPLQRGRANVRTAAVATAVS